MKFGIALRGGLAALFALALLWAAPARADDFYDIPVIASLTGGGAFLGHGGARGAPVGGENRQQDRRHPRQEVALRLPRRPVECRSGGPAAQRLVALATPGDPGLDAGRRPATPWRRWCGHRPGAVLLLARHPPGRRQLRLHLRRLDPRPGDRAAALFPPAAAGPGSR